MVAPVILVIVGVVAMLLVIYLSRRNRAAENNLDELVAQLRSIDVDAFRNLIDPGEEQFLREYLPAAEFRSIHRDRMLAAVEYVWGAAHNAGLLIRLADAAKLDPDPSVVTAAENLLENAVRVRLDAFRVIPRLYLGMLMPGLNRAPQLLAESYDNITRQVVTLGCLQAPTRSLPTTSD